MNNQLLCALIALSAPLPTSHLLACQCFPPRDVKTPAEMHEYVLKKRATAIVEACVTRVSPPEAGECAGCGQSKASLRVLQTLPGGIPRRLEVDIVGCGEEVEALVGHLQRLRKARTPATLYLNETAGVKGYFAYACEQPDVKAGTNLSLLDDILPAAFRRQPGSC
jgi:hypothetical protein